MGNFRTVDDFLALLQGVKKLGNGKYQALCPAHDDHEPSLNVTVEGDTILLHCKAGCPTKKVLEVMGLAMADLFLNGSKSSQRKEVAVYKYRDFEVVRYEPKGFSQRRPDGKGGYIYNLEGVERRLYHDDELPEAIEKGSTIYILEGEKDVDRLRDLGLIATCNSGGAGKWKDSYSEALKGADVVILPDKDEPGRKHAEQIARSLLGKANSIKVVDLPGSSKDIADWLQSGGDKEALMQLVMAATNYVPHLAGSDDKAGLFQITDLGPVKIFTQAISGIQIKVRHIKEHDDGRVTAIIEIKTIENAPARILTSQINLTAPETLKKTAYILEKKRASIEWQRWLEEIASYVIETARPKAEYTEVWIDDNHQYEKPGYLVDQLVKEGTINYIYGPGGSLKTYMAMILAFCITLPWKDNPLGLTVIKSGKVLWLDWENPGPDYFGWRMKMMIKALKVFDMEKTPNLWFDYLHCKTALADDIERILEFIKAKGITVVFIDSLALAAGGGKEDLFKAEAALNFTQSLHLLGCTVVVLAHTPKSEDNAKTIYGSGFFEYLGRNVWYARKEQAEGSSIADIILKQRKANDAPMGTELGFRFSFKGDELDNVQSINPASNGYGYGSTHSVVKITDAIKAGVNTVNAMVEHTGIKYDTIYKTLTRNEGKLFKREGEGWTVI